jgi:hypothetical protein
MRFDTAKSERCPTDDHRYCTEANAGGHRPDAAPPPPRTSSTAIKYLPPSPDNNRSWLHFPPTYSIQVLPTLQTCTPLESSRSLSPPWLAWHPPRTCKQDLFSSAAAPCVGITLTPDCFLAPVAPQSNRWNNCDRRRQHSCQPDRGGLVHLELQLGAELQPRSPHLVVLLLLSVLAPFLKSLAHLIFQATATSLLAPPARRRQARPRARPLPQLPARRLAAAALLLLPPPPRVPPAPSALPPACSSPPVPLSPLSSKRSSTPLSGFQFPTPSTLNRNNPTSLLGRPKGSMVDWGASFFSLQGYSK